MKQWYESLFENYGQKYDQEVYTQGTLGECDFKEMQDDQIQIPSSGYSNQ